MKKRSKYSDMIPTVERICEEGKTDREIAEVIGAPGAKCVAQLRYRNGIGSPMANRTISKHGAPIGDGAERTMYRKELKDANAKFRKLLRKRAFKAKDPGDGPGPRMPRPEPSIHCGSSMAEVVEMGERG